MIKRSGKSWGIYTLLQVKMKLVTAKLHVSLKLNHVAFDSRLQGFLTILQYAITRSNVVCLFTKMNWGLLPPKSHDCLIYTEFASQERPSVSVCLKKSQGFYKKLTLKIKSYCIVSKTIPIVVTVKMLILFIQVDQMYPHWHEERSLPPYCPDLAISNISPNNKVNTNYNG
jgi:hypothetical protein